MATCPGCININNCCDACRPGLENLLGITKPKPAQPTHFMYEGKELLDGQCLVIILLQQEIPIMQVCEDLAAAEKLVSKEAYGNKRKSSDVLGTYIYEADGVCRRYSMRKPNAHGYINVKLDVTPHPLDCSVHKMFPME